MEIAYRLYTCNAISTDGYFENVKIDLNKQTNSSIDLASSE